MNLKCIAKSIANTSSIKIVPNNIMNKINSIQSRLRYSSLERIAATKTLRISRSKQKVSFLYFNRNDVSSNIGICHNLCRYTANELSEELIISDLELLFATSTHRLCSQHEYLLLIPRGLIGPSTSIKEFDQIINSQKSRITIWDPSFNYLNKMNTDYAINQNERISILFRLESDYKDDFKISVKQGFPLFFEKEKLYFIALKLIENDKCNWIFYSRSFNKSARLENPLHHKLLAKVLYDLNQINYAFE